MAKLYYPSDAALVRTLTHGVLLNSPVTANEVAVATKIYGKEIAALN